jgi:predicted ATPase
MGKSRLTLEIGGRLSDGMSASAVTFPDGILFVELDTANTMEQMIAAIATTLGFALGQELDPLQQVLNFLSNKRLLLLLDNFEHLVSSPANGAEVVAAVLKAAPEVKIIATSRQKLNLSSETLFVLEGMAFPDWQTTTDALSYSAVQLFVQSARRARLDFDLTTENLPHVAGICHLTEGMPLGIVLAAAWIDMLSLAEIAEEIQADIDFLAGEMEDLPPRQHSMRAVFDYSWARLTEPEQQVLARLSVFHGGFTREAAQAVTGATLRQLLALVNKSLIQQNVESGRFTLHDLLRQLAAEKLDALGETDDLQLAHSRYYLTWLAGHEDGLQRFRQLETVRILRPDDQNIQAAWLWAASSDEANQLMSVIRPYTHYSMLTGRTYDADRLYRQALQRLPAGDPTFTDTADEITFVRASLLNRVQELGYTQDDNGPEIDIDRLYAFFQARGASLEEALVCQHLAIRAVREQDFSQAMAYFQTKVELYEQEDELFGLPLTLGRMAMVAVYDGQVEAGLEFGQRATARAEKYNSILDKPVGLFLLAIYTLFEKNDYGTSQELTAELTVLALESWAHGLNAISVLGSLTYQGFIALLQGRLDQAQQCSQKMYELAAVRNSSRDKLSADAIAGLIKSTMGQYETVNLQALESKEGGVLNIGPIGVALAAYGKGNIPLAVMTVVRAWSTLITRRWPSILLQFIPVVASILADQGELFRAAALMTMARAHPACPRGWWEIMVLVQELEARLQAALSAQEYAAAQA